MTSALSADALLRKVWSVSGRLKASGIWHEVRGTRHDGLTIIAHVPGQYWEFDFLEDGKVDVEVFKSDGRLEEEVAIDRLIDEFSEPN